MKKMERLMTGGVVAALGLLVAASVAWACTPLSALSVIADGNTTNGNSAASPSSGPAGSRVTLQGRQYGAGPVEIRWDSLAGPKLAEPSGPDFVVEVTVPADASNGVHYFVGVQYKAGSRTINGQSRAAYEVTPADEAETVTTSGGNGEVSGGSRDFATTSGGTARRTGTGQNIASASGAEDTQTSEGSDFATASGRDGQVAGQSSNFAPVSGAESGSGAPSAQNRTASTPAGPSTSATGLPASVNPGFVVDESGRTVFGGSVGSSAAGAVTSGSDVAGEAGLPSNVSVSSDLYSGFENSAGAPVPGIADPAAAERGTSQGLLMGAALLAAGVVALLAGASLAVFRRRRALAPGNSA